MGKRSRPVEENYEAIANKFRKLERKLMRARRRDRHNISAGRRSSSSSSSDSSSSSSSSSTSSRSRSRSPRRDTAAAPQTERLCIEDMPTTAGADVNPQPSTSTAEPQPSTSTAEPQLSTSTAEPQPSTSAAVPLPVPTPPLHSEASPAASELDVELLEILGEDPSRTKMYGMNIQSDLAIRLQHIATTGLSKEERSELLQRYLPPANCTSIDAPVLNPEVKAAISETVYKRDKGIELKQRQTSSATSGLAEALTLLISSEPKNRTLIKLLMDAIKLLCDSQFSDSVTRRNFVLYNLKKELKDQLQATKIDKFLFSEDLSEALRAAKAITKSGTDLKFTPYPPSKKPAKNKNKPHQRNLNWRGPPLSHRPKGNQRTKEPAYKSHQDNSSKQSSRQDRIRSRRR